MNLIVFRRRADRAQIGRRSYNAAIPIIPDVKRCVRTMGGMKVLGIAKFNLHLHPIKKGSYKDQHEPILDTNVVKFYKSTNSKIGVNERQSMSPHKFQDGFQYFESFFDGVHTFLRDITYSIDGSPKMINKKPIFKEILRALNG